MNPSHADSQAQDLPPVQELVQQRELLRGWLARLDQVGREAPERVASRVRDDYQARLHRVTAELAGYREEIARSLDGARAELQETEESRARALDALEEMRLRAMIGELDESGWEEARPPLERDVETAEQARAQAAEQVEHLSSLLGEVDASEAIPAQPVVGARAAPAAETTPPAEAAPLPAMDAFPAVPDGPPTPVEEETDPWEPLLPSEPPTAGGPERDPFGDDYPVADATAEPAATDGGDLPWLDDLGGTQGTDEWGSPGTGLDFLDQVDERTQPTPPASTSSSGGLAADDLAFLEELDRAISGPPAGGAGKSAAPTPPPPASTPTPPPGVGGAAAHSTRVLCKECGALNEQGSWYCEVCGSEL